MSIKGAMTIDKRKVLHPRLQKNLFSGWTRTDETIKV